MAYMDQTRKATISKAVKPILARYGVKGSLSVRNHSTICLTLTSGSVDFIGDLNADRDYILQRTPEKREEMRKDYHLSVNPYWFQEHYEGESYHFLKEVFDAMKAANWYDRSDAQIDYFDTAYYVDVNVGKWNKPYTLTN